MAPRRTSSLRMLRALVAEQGESARVDPAPTPPALPEAPEPGFDFDAYALGTKATKLAIRMRGRHFVSTHRGRAFVEKIAQHLRDGEVLEVAKLRDKYHWNELPSYAQHLAKLQADIDASPYGPYGL